MFGQPEPLVRKFIAAFDSDCFTCGGVITENDTAGYLPGDEGASCAWCIGEEN